MPLHLVVGVRLDDLAVTDADLPRRSIVGGASIYPFVQNLLLALRAEGLGAAMTTLLVPAEEAVRELLGIPQEIALAAHVGVGPALAPGRCSSPAAGCRSSPSPSAGASARGPSGAVAQRQQLVQLGQLGRVDRVGVLGPG